MLACFGMFRFGPTWEEALCMFDQNGLEAMLACFGMFLFGPTLQEALRIIDKNGLEAMLARFGVFCVCMCWKWCWHVYVLEAMAACFVLFQPGTILIRRGRRARGCRTGMAFFEFVGVSVSFSMFPFSSDGMRFAHCWFWTFVLVKTSLTVGVWWFFFAVRRWPKMLEVFFAASVVRCFMAFSILQTLCMS